MKLEDVPIYLLPNVRAALGKLRTYARWVAHISSAAAWAEREAEQIEAILRGEVPFPDWSPAVLRGELL